MTNFFVNLPLGFLSGYPEYEDLFLSNLICPELGIDARSIDFLGPDRHARMAELFQSRGINTAVHMPFIDLQPGSLDEFIRRASTKRLVLAARLGNSYHPRHFIIHSGYRPEIYDNNYSKWLENSVSTWKEVLEEIPDVPVYLENVYEQDPCQIKDLLTELGGRAGFCFDPGHWFSYGRGAQKQDLGHWLQTLAPNLGHLHLHDNDGSSDGHLGMGTGEIPFAQLFAALELLDIHASFTMEPHSREDFEQSLGFILDNQYWFSLLGLKKDDFDHLKEIASGI